MTSQTAARRAWRSSAVCPSHAARLAEKNRGRPAAPRSCAPARRSDAAPPLPHAGSRSSAAARLATPCADARGHAALPARPAEPAPASRIAAAGGPSDPPPQPTPTRRPPAAPSIFVCFQPISLQVASSVPLLARNCPPFTCLTFGVHSIVALRDRAPIGWAACRIRTVTPVALLELPHRRAGAPNPFRRQAGGRTGHA